MTVSGMHSDQRLHRRVRGSFCLLKALTNDAPRSMSLGLTGKLDFKPLKLKGGSPRKSCCVYPGG